MDDKSGEQPEIVAGDSVITNDCYSAGERAAMQRNQRLRERLFAPLLQFLTWIRVRPDHVTVISLIAGLGFSPAFGCWPELGFGLLFLHVVLDGLDGPLARFQHVASRRGSFVDTMADQLVVFASMLTLMSAGRVGLVPGGVYIFVYTLVVAFAMVRNALNVPYSWLIRPRFAFYLWIPVEHYLWPNSLTWLVAAFDAVLSWKLLTGFSQLNRTLGRGDPESN